MTSEVATHSAEAGHDLTPAAVDQLVLMGFSWEAAEEHVAQSPPGHEDDLAAAQAGSREAERQKLLHEHPISRVFLPSSPRSARRAWPAFRDNPKSLR
jgi:hypothetical protein